MKQRIYKGLLMAGIVLGLFSACKQDKMEYVHLKGRLVDMPTRTVTMSYDGASSFLGNSKDITLSLDKDGCFDTIFPLNTPSYFNISRNTIYLEPGDDLTVEISTKNSEAKFEGRGAEANEYMKDRLFPHAGSFLEGGMNVKEDFESTRCFIDSLAMERRNQLIALQHVSSEFKNLEKARISADLLNSYSYYPIYANIQAQIRKTPELAIRKHQMDSFYTALSKDTKLWVEELNQEAFLDVAAVRSMLASLITERHLNSWCEGIVFNPMAQELVQAAVHVDNLSHQLNTETLDKAVLFANEMSNQEYANELRTKIEEARQLLSGPAIDFTFVDLDGNSYRLSDFKGKVIYLDFWATWCCPCVKESPYFEALAKEFADKKDIVFLAISTDANQKTWANYLKTNTKQLPQYHSTDKALKEEWGLKYIPRFVLIDRDFNIVEAYAPKPSEDRTRELLLKLLK